jgi:hypothetical protein
VRLIHRLKIYLLNYKGLSGRGYCPCNVSDTFEKNEKHSYAKEKKNTKEFNTAVPC